MNYAFHLPDSLIIAAVTLDVAWGDPRWLPHPVRMIGRLIEAGDRRLNRGSRSSDLINGTALTLAVIVSAGLATWILIVTLHILSPLVSAIGAVVIASTALALRGLNDAARKVERSLRADNIAAARHSIRALAGRDPERLDSAGLIRAAIESIAENASDGFIAPLFFLVLAGPVGAITYKAINTLDSMIGYRDSRHLYFGRVAARTDDFANLVPSRLTAVGIVVAAMFVTRRSLVSLRTVVADGGKHQSPNAGYPEAAMAGALGIELGGDAYYAGELEHRPRLGRGEAPPDVTALRHAQTITWIASAFGLIILLTLRAIITNLLA